MSARIVVSCDADWNGMPCQAALRIPASRLVLARNDDLADLYRARNIAFEAGWRQTPGRTGDLCPAHARHQQTELMRDTAAEHLQLDPPTAAWLTNLLGPDWADLIPAPGRSRTP